MDAEEAQTGDVAVLDAIPLVVVAEDSEAPARARWGFRVPRIVDYLIVATFMYFVL
jgi:hypothetical protein